MSESKDITSIPQLTSTNYAVWSERILQAIGAKNAEVALVLEGTIPRPTKDADPKSEAVSTWEKGNFVARNIIFRTLSDVTLQSMREHRDCLSLWNALKDRYEKIDHTQLMQMLMEFMALKQGKTQSFDSFLDDILSRQATIAATGSPVTDDQVMQVLVFGLNKSYTMWIPALSLQLNTAKTSGVTGPVIINQLISTIRTASHQISSMNPLQQPAAERVESALASQYRQQPGRLHCTHCLHTGHNADNCFVNPASPSFKGSAEKAKAEATRLYRQSQARRNKQRKSPKSTVTKASPDLERGLVAATAFPGMLHSDKWLIDSGASSHMTFCKSDFAPDLILGSNLGHVTVGGNRRLPVTGIGSVVLDTIIDGAIVQRTLRDVFLVPRLDFRLFSIEATLSRGFHPVYSDGGFKVMDPVSNTVMLDSIKIGKARFIRCKDVEFGLVTTKPIDPSYQLWHQRLGHIAEKAVKLTLSSSAQHSDVSPVTGDICSACQSGGQVRHSFLSKSEDKALCALALVHSDVVGPLPASMSKKQYFVTFVDDKTGYVTINAMATKDEVFQHFHAYLPGAERATGNLLKVLRTDGGGEYVNGRMKEFLASKGIEHQITMPRSPQQNGVAERMNRTLCEMMRTMLVNAGAPDNLWAEALSLAVWIHNRVPRGKRSSPYKAWFKHQPALDTLRSFGCLAYSVDTTQKKKLDSRSIPLIFLGFSPGRKGWKLFNRATNSVVHSIDVIFDESVFPFKDCSDPREGAVVKARLTSLITERSTQQSDSEDSGNEDGPITIQEDNPSEYHTETSSILSDPPSEDEGIEARPQRARQLPSRLQDYHMAPISAHALVCAEGDSIDSNVVPLTMEQAKALATWPFWQQALNVEAENHRKNGTWVLCKLPPGRKAIGCRPVFAIKYNANGSLNKFKIRFTAKGFAQIEGIDFQEVFSPLVRPGTIRFVLAIAAMNDWPIHQADVVAAYLNGHLKEEIYMIQPPGLEDGTDRVCKLIKGLYGLKQSGRVWYQAAHDQLTKMDFRCIEADQGLYVKGGLDHPLSAIICLYVDDMIITASTLQEVESIKSTFHRRFSIVDGGSISFILGLQVTRSATTLSLGQETYIKKMAVKYGLDKSAPVSTPLPLNFNMEDADAAAPLPPSLKLAYQSMIGAVMYAAMGTRLDVAFTAQLLSRKLQQPTTVHYLYAKHLIRYLNSTASYSLKYPVGISNGLLTAFCDADYAGDKATARSTSGVLTSFNGGYITWMSKRQDCVAVSTLESEYISLCEMAKEVSWLRALLEQFGMKQKEATSAFADNQSANAFAQDTRFHRRTKHINVRYHYTRDQVKDGVIKIIYIPTAAQQADILTKALPKVKHDTAVKQLNLPQPGCNREGVLEPAVTRA